MPDASIFLFEETDKFKADLADILSKTDSNETVD